MVVNILPGVNSGQNNPSLKNQREILKESQAYGLSK